VDGDRYLLDEDVINSNSQEQVTLSERMEELEEEVNMVSIDPEKRKGRKITAPRRFQDFYYF
jgi:tetrahydromethanopterin S-methyltransferase subunit G